MSSSTYLLSEQAASHSGVNKVDWQTALIQKAEVILRQSLQKIDEAPWFNVPSIWINLRETARRAPSPADDTHSITQRRAG